MKAVVAVAVVVSIAAPAAFAQGSFLKTLLKVAGISATPSGQRGPGDELETGDVWMSSIAEQARLRLTRDGGYRSPVFAPADESVLALRGSTLVSIAVSSGEVNALHELTRPVKLVGFTAERPHEVLALFDDATGAPWIGFVALATGTVTPVRHDPSAREDSVMLAHVKDWQRVYGDTSVYVKTESRYTTGGAAEWTDVYLKRGTSLVNVSRCDGVSCGQPSLSHSGRRVVYVKAGP
jgi:hypothetical protein